MVNKPVISHFHSLIMTENLLELKCNRRVKYIVLNAQNQRGSLFLSENIIDSFCKNRTN